MKKTEQAFLIAFKKWIIDSNYGGFWFKIPDSPTKKQIAKPFDAFYLLNGTFYAYEAKALRGNESLKLSHLRQSQIDGLSRTDSNDGRAMVLAYYEDHKAFMRVSFEELQKKGSIEMSNLKPITI